MDRMQRVYEKYLEMAKLQPSNHFEYDRDSYEKGKYADLQLWERKARSVADAVLNQEIYVFADDKIIGRVYHEKEKRVEGYDRYGSMFAEARKKTNEVCPAYEEWNDFRMVSMGSFGHIAWNWNDMLALGTEGIREKCKESLITNGSNSKSVEFLNGVMIMLDALDKWNDMHVEKLVEMGKTEEVEICKRVPKYPARNFREAVQSYFMQHIVVMKEAPYGGNSPGRLDYYLWPYLERDLKNGVCTLEEASDLIEELFLRIDERLYAMHNWGETVVLGGSHTDGTSAVNPLTYVMVKVFMKHDITHPYFYMRMPENPPQEYVDLCAKYVMEGNNRAQIVNDKAVVSALMAHGVSKEDAYNYYCGGCMEVGVQGKTSDLLFTGLQSVPNILEFCITGGYSLAKKIQLKNYKPKSLLDFNDFESFYAYVLSQFKEMAYHFFDHMDRVSEYLEKNRPQYLLCSMIDGCIEKGGNQHSGVVKYHDYGATILGLPNASDSLFAIKKAVFDDKICTASQLIEALKADFVGYEQLRKKLLAIPKYGQENDEADEMMRRLCRDTCAVYFSYKNRFGGYAKPVILTFVYAPEVGAVLGATPDGRKAGVPIAQSVTPQNLAITKGITCAMNSASTLDMDLFPGGATTMWDLDSSWANADIVKWLITSYFEKGGQFFQGNVTDVEDLIKAQKNPENYHNVIVRVGGYSARFVDLNKGLQNDVINRYRHNG